MNKKVIKSLLISLAGIALTAGTYLGNEVIDYLSTGNPVDFKTALIMSLSAIGAWVANTIREYVKFAKKEGE